MIWVTLEEYNAYVENGTKPSGETKPLEAYATFEAAKKAREAK